MVALIQNIGDTQIFANSGRSYFYKMLDSEEFGEIE